MRVGQVLGVNLRVHYLFLLWLLVSLTLGDATLTLVMLFSVLVHELGHMFAAQNLGLEVEEIELMPFGGVAKLRGFASGDPAEEATLALGGPANSLVLLVIGLFYYGAPWGVALLESNALLLLVNLLPILPLDGGRILRSYCVGQDGLGAGTRRVLTHTFRAVWIFLGAATVLFLLGVVSINAVALALFLLHAARQEKKMFPYMLMNYVTTRTAELWHKRVLPGKLVMVLSDTSAAEAVEAMTPGCYHVFNVVRPNGEVLTVSEDLLCRALLAKGTVLTFSDIVNDRRL